jgi:hypothetical protein
VEIVTWLQIWLIVNALFVAWRVLAISAEAKAQDQFMRRDVAGHPQLLSQEALRRPVLIKSEPKRL